MVKLDAHMHVWTLGRGDYDWLTPSFGAIYRDFDLDDVWEEARSLNVACAILVQAAASSAETDYLLDLAAGDQRIAGVVGWVDFSAPNAVEQIRARALDRRLLGLRPMIGDIPDPEWILQESFADAFAEMAHRGLVLDAHARPDLVTVMATLASRHPDLQIVLNHGGKPPIASGALDGWRADIENLSGLGNVACKLSGLLTEAGPHTDDSSIAGVVTHLADCFGADRLFWGSDWPVLTMAGDYTGWVRQCERLLGRFSVPERDAIWRGNAARIYLSRTGASHGQT